MSSALERLGRLAPSPWIVIGVSPDGEVALIRIQYFGAPAPGARRSADRAGRA